MTASATSFAKRSSEPYCFEARVGLKARIKLSVVRGVSNVLRVNSTRPDQDLVSFARGTEPEEREVRTL